MQQPRDPSARLKPDREFEFPQHCHLLITTPSRIYAWDYSSVRVVFQSNKGGIVAAREAPNDSGLLAVADRHVVVLHDTRRGQEKSWGLGADDDEVRQLEYAADAKLLYFSTNLTADIQRYSTELSRLLDPAGTHASPPIALAISPTGRYMVSASDYPPVVYLRNLDQNNAAVLIEPRASRTAVSVCAFHPERPNVFLLAFRDGTAAAYDAMRIIATGTGSVSNQESVNKGEFCHVSGLHRAASSGSRHGAITDAAFLPGFKWRAVTVGNDGRCRIIDFADGGVTLRTWHAKGSVTAVSVLPVKSASHSRRRGSGNTASHVIGGPTSTDSLIAVGRVDGEVLIYDSVGLLLDQCNMRGTGEGILSVKWIKGPPPAPVDSPGGVLPMVDTTPTVAEVAFPTENASQTTTRQTTPNIHSHNGSIVQEHVVTAPAPPRKFTIHPDEVEAGDDTVRRTSLPDRHQPRRMVTGAFADLFSPWKPTKDEDCPNASPHRIASPSRSRPPITSQTFIKSPAPGDPAKYDTMARRRNLALFPSTDSKPEIASPVESMYGRKMPNATIFPSPNKRLTFGANTIHPAHRHPRYDLVPTQSDEKPNSLPIRRMSNGQGAANHLVTGRISVLDSTAPNHDKTAARSDRKKTRLHFLHRSADHIETEADSDTAREAYEHVHKKHRWPEDSNQDSSMGSNHHRTSSARQNAGRRRKSENLDRPPARQTSRSRVNTNGTTSTVDQPRKQAVSSSPQPPQRLDGSTEEDMLTADTHITSSGTFSPSSKDIHELFPRSSSLSPRKSRRSRKSPGRSPPADQRPMGYSMPDRPVDRPSKSPWARARKLRTGPDGTSMPKTAMRDLPLQEKTSGTDGQAEDSTRMSCGTCCATQARLLALEAELARLKSDVIDIKAGFNLSKA